MFHIGIDLHKKTLSLCVVGSARQVLDRKTLHCRDRNSVLDYFATRRPFRAVVEATAGYEWLCDLHLAVDSN